MPIVTVIQDAIQRVSLHSRMDFTFLRHFGRKQIQYRWPSGIHSRILHWTGCIGWACVRQSVLNYGRRYGQFGENRSDHDIKCPLYIDVYLARGEAEPSNVHGIDSTATSARENIAKLESASNISASQMMLTTPSWRPRTRNSTRWHPIRLRPRAAVSSTV
ncbi:hypothetical protein M405DRAFT_480692 [Rhizopogon salebrosus TDB-379]|nr:hypothetical protein M405DRAFT_480692 [Rhizopogon salebrosus TDB-379]